MVDDDRTHYDILGIEPGASKSEIKQAYQEGLQAADGAGDTETRLRIRRAWQVLSDPVQRSRYDDSVGVTTRTQPVGRRARDERIGRHRRPNRRCCRRRRHRGRRRRRRRGRVDVDRKWVERQADGGRARLDGPAAAGPSRATASRAASAAADGGGPRAAHDGAPPRRRPHRRHHADRDRCGISPARDGRVRRRAVRDLRRRLPRRDLPVRGPPRVAHRADARQADDVHDGRRPRDRASPHPAPDPDPLLDPDAARHHRLEPRSGRRDARVHLRVRS